MASVATWAWAPFPMFRSPMPAGGPLVIETNVSMELIRLSKRPLSDAPSGSPRSEGEPSLMITSAESGSTGGLLGAPAVDLTGLHKIDAGAAGCVKAGWGSGGAGPLQRARTMAGRRVAVSPTRLRRVTASYQAAVVLGIGLPQQRCPVLRESGLVAGEQRVVSRLAHFGADLPFEPVLICSSGIGAVRLWPVVEGRSVVAAEADRDQVVVFVLPAGAVWNAVFRQRPWLVVPDAMRPAVASFADHRGVRLGDSAWREPRIRQYGIIG